MDPMRLIIDKQTSERLQEATDNRLFRASPAENDERSRPGWPTRARRRLGDSLVAAGETLRSSPDEQPAAHVEPRDLTGRAVFSLGRERLTDRRDHFCVAG